MVGAEVLWTRTLGLRMSNQRIIRCAIYTRKSTEEGLEQDFNSLDAQREACSSYICSQRSEGWLERPDRFDDGGFSGGTLERPALQQLMKQIEAGEIDVVVVYKIDRLTRSLLDFAKLVDQLERRHVTFVSVTQSFNTTTSMGRLTLNVLLSFAQFEREVTGERIRDKIAASKKKGIWMGGYPPLGYDIGKRKLIVNAAEAETVNLIFRRYLELGCVRTLQRELEASGIKSKHWISTTGKAQGGQPFGRGALYCLLKNRTYLGETTHKGAAYAGEHAPIVSKDLFLAVEERLGAARRRQLGTPSSEQSAFLVGLLFDSTGRGMTPTYTLSRGKNYPYYVTATRAAPDDNDRGVFRVQASGVDELVRAALIALDLPAAASAPHESMTARAYLRRVELHSQSTKLVVDRARTLEWWRTRHPVAGITDDELISLRREALTVGMQLSEIRDHFVLTLPLRAQFRGGRAGMLLSPAARPRRDAALIRAVAKAHCWKAALVRGEIRSLNGLAKRLNKERRYVTGILSLAFLSPTITRAILEGRQPPSLRLKHLLNTKLPLSWRAQESDLKIDESADVQHWRVFPALVSEFPVTE